MSNGAFRFRVMAAAVALGVVATTLAGCSGENDTPDTDTIVADDGCTPVIVATSSEKVNLMEDLGELFKKSPEYSSLSECATVYPVNVASGKAAKYLSDSTTEWALGNDTAPSVWSPASTVWTERVASIAGEKVVAGAESFAKTPVVFGMPESMAKALGYPAKDIGIAQIHELIENPDGWGSVGKSLWGSFKIAKTNPNSSTTGLSTLLMQAYAASGKTQDLTTADVGAAEEFSRVFESGAIHYGDTTGKVLQNLADKTTGGGSSYVSAITLEETSLYNYNIGNPDSHTVQPGETLTPPDEKLVAIYPSEGSMWSDNPAVVLNADWVTPEQKTAATAFVEFLHTKDAQQVLPEYGFRPLDASVDVSTTLNGIVGIDPAQPKTTLPQPAPEVVSAAIDQWTQIRKPSAILQLIDVSGSMDEVIDGGKTRLDGAIAGSTTTLGEVRSTDEIGVWAFTTGLTSEIDGTQAEGIAVVRPFSVLGGDKEAMRSDIQDLANAQRGGTPLYDAIATAYDYMKQHAETGRINAIVVLSDGEDTDSRIQLDSLIQKINADQKEGGNDKSVRIFAIAYSSSADVESLENLARASGGQVFDATDPTKITETFQSVMNNF
ncbi:substrate-binding and VWA domain-containing protein [Rarobacter faecitabidus]|uniref:Ca-activated chloride channel family protein n=1 Tax=Rarobacter faecitabidus TaxID=13243 RepID=A0A542ZXJ8_RARFA|nr:substrate-binding and VWA domain-containing protein [Rarobacter faecitabidus]TQL64926.1 Ca-activated chloride channel family protein [Rarobacter faecitabidus]